MTGIRIYKFTKGDYPHWLLIIQTIGNATGVQTKQINTLDGDGGRGWREGLEGGAGGGRRAGGRCGILAHQKVAHGNRDRIDIKP